MDINRKDLLALYLPVLFLAVVLVLNYIASIETSTKFDKIDQKIEDKNGEIQKQLTSLRKQIEYLRQEVSSSKKEDISPESGGKEPIKVDASPEIVAQKRPGEGTLLPLTPDPFFQKLSKGTKTNQTIVVGIPADEKGFNRILQNSAQIVEWHDHYVNDFLAHRHWESPENWAPHLAERVEVSADNREFKITIRKNVLWHKPQVDWRALRYRWLQGTHYVTSGDFYFAYTTIMNPQVKAHHLHSAYDQIESFSIIDDYTFSIRWKKTLYTNLVYTLEQFPLPRFLFSRDENGNEFPPAVFGEEFNRHWYNDRMLGCGPYIFIRHEEGKYVEFIRNEDYYGYRPAIQQIRFAVENDSDAAFEKLKKGEIDVIPHLPEHIYQRYLDQTGDPKLQNFEIEIYERALYFHIKWNNEHPIFRDKMVRRAMTYAFDRERALKEFFMGQGTIAASDIPSNSDYYNKNIKPYPYNLDMARKILSEQGWRDENGDGILEKFIDGQKVDFVFTLYYAKKDGENHRKMYEMYRDALKQIGVKMTHEAIEWSEMIAKYETKDFMAIRGAWLTDLPLVDYYQIWHSRFADDESSSNQIHFKHSEADTICIKMREAGDLEERVRLSHRMQEILHEEQPYTFLFYTNGFAGFNVNVENRFIRKYRPYVLTHPYYVK